MLYLFNTGTPGEQAVRAVEADFQYLRAWCNGEWHWVAYHVEIAGTDYHDSLCGIDSPSMEDFTKQAFDEAVHWLDRELTESAWAVDHGVESVS